MEFSFTLQPSPIESTIEIGESLLSKGLDYCFKNSDRTFIVTTDSLVPYLKDIHSPIVLPFGEKIKQRSYKELLENSLFQNGCSSKSYLIGVGGGALLDLVGYTASTYCRGINYVTFPTTLLAMCDAAIGGKTGINLGEAKNYLGSFYFPNRIYLDLSWLDSLSENEFINGISETIKHAVIGDENLFTFLIEEKEKILRRDKLVLREMITASVQVKLGIIQKDPFEKSGLRRILNFGHTIAHAIESQSGYSVSHGEAVAMGMLVEGAMSMRLGILDLTHFEKLSELILSFPFTFSFPRFLPFESMGKDKKGGAVFVPLKKIGEIASTPGYIVAFSENLFKQVWKDALCLVEKRKLCGHS